MKLPKYFGPRVAAKYLDLSIHTLRKKIERGEIHPIRVGSGPKPRHKFTQEICDDYYRQPRINVRGLKR